MKIIRLFIIIVISIAGIFIFILAINPNESPKWTGFGRHRINEQFSNEKTLWDWLDLLIIPLAIGVLAWSFKESEKEKADKLEDERMQNEGLDSFIKIMTELIIKHNLASTHSTPETRTIARTRINLAFSNLNGTRKGQVLQFLYESGLIDKNPTIKLVGGNIKYAVLDGIVLIESEIKGAYFNEASIKDSNLNDAVFTSCDFTDADLSGSLMRNVDLSYTKLIKAKLKNMDLTSVNFEGANLTNADLRESDISQGQLDSIFLKQGIKTTKSKIR